MQAAYASPQCDAHANATHELPAEGPAARLVHVAQERAQRADADAADEDEGEVLRAQARTPSPAARASACSKSLCLLRPRHRIAAWTHRPPARSMRRLHACHTAGRACDSSCPLMARWPRVKAARPRPSAVLTGSERRSSPSASARTAENILARARAGPLGLCPEHRPHDTTRVRPAKREHGAERAQCRRPGRAWRARPGGRMAAAAPVRAVCGEAVAQQVLCRVGQGRQRRRAAAAPVQAVRGEAVTQQVLRMAGQRAGLERAPPRAPQLHHLHEHRARQALQRSHLPERSRRAQSCQC